MAGFVVTSTDIVRKHAAHMKLLRAGVFQRLYPAPASKPSSSPANPLVQLADTFTRYASTQATAYDKGTAGGGGVAGTNLMERQVERAITQVLGRSPGRGSDSFMAALNGAFPANVNGQVSTTPGRSAVSLYSPGGNSNTPNLGGTTAAGLTGQLSAEQATLYRQTSVVAADALRVLDSLQPFVPEAETDRVEALRALVRTEINSLVEEFGRLDEPRAKRVDAYFDSLRSPYGHLFEFGQQSFLARGMATAATTMDEAQIAGFDLLRNYVDSLKAAWDIYNVPANSVAFPLFTERLSRSSVLLPVIAEGNNNFMSAMDSIGFTESERRSAAAKFTSMTRDKTASAKLPDITVNDLNEWIDRFASMEGPSSLADSGQYGLAFVGNQADALFWVFVPILKQIKVTGAGLSSSSVVAQVLAHERVSWALDDLINQLKTLADEAA